VKAPRKKPHVFLIFIIIILILLIALLLFLLPKNKPEEVSPLASLSKETYAVSFINLPKPPPTAIELYISFDPNKLRAESLEAGDIWGETNELQKVIDNKNGSIIYSVGQNFGSEFKNGKIVAKIEFSLLQKSSGLNDVSLGEGSFMARTGENKPVSLQNLLDLSKIEGE
jgi:hypothetical protein